MLFRRHLGCLGRFLSEKLGPLLPSYFFFCFESVHQEEKDKIGGERLESVYKATHPYVLMHTYSAPT